MLDQDLDSVDFIGHARSGRWRGTLADATHRSHCRNPVCGDQVRIEVRVRNGTVEEIRFQAQGCFISQASASMVCENAIGSDVATVANMTAEELLGFPLAKLIANRQRCAALACEAVWRALSGSAEQTSTAK